MFIIDYLLIGLAILIFWAGTQKNIELICLLIAITVLIIVIKGNQLKEGFVDEAIQNMASLYNDKKVIADRLEVTSAKIGDWEIRGDRIGIPDKGDFHFADDGWMRLLTYDGNTDTYAGKDDTGGFAAKNFWTSRGGTVDVDALKNDIIAAKNKVQLRGTWMNTALNGDRTGCEDDIYVKNEGGNLILDMRTCGKPKPW